MAHCVFLMHKYLPYSDANVHCVRNVIEQLVSDGNTVSVVCGNDDPHLKAEQEIDGVTVYRVKHMAFNDRYATIKSGLFRLVYKALHYLKLICLFPAFPDFEPLFSKKLEKKLEEIASKSKIDYIIGVFQPYATISALKTFAQKHPDIKTVAYYLDVLKGASVPKVFPSGKYQRLCDKTEISDFKRFDKILIADQSKEYYSADDYSGFPICYVNFPSFVIRKCQRADGESNSVKLVYAGYLDINYRNPLPLVDAVVKLSQNKKIELHIYGSSNMDAVLQELSEKNEGVIFYHGRVNTKEIEKAYYNADVLVNIGNDIKGVVPSKVYELAGYNKKILHLSPGENDDTVDIIKVLPNVCIVKKDAKDIKETINGFLEKKTDFLPDEELRKLFVTSSPEYVAGKIIKREMVDNDNKNRS